MSNIQELNNIASQVRRDILRMVTAAQSGHPGGSMSSTDIMTALFFSEMKHSPANWDRSGKGNDMFFLSAGHMSPVFYSVLARSGYFPVKELATFRVFGSRLQGHPCVESGLPGVYEASGSLGQGLSVAAGAAIGKRLDKEENYVYVLMGDGESEEGQVWEACMAAAHYKLDNLVVIVDNNGLQIDGNVADVMSPYPIFDKLVAFGFHTIAIDGHDFDAIEKALNQARKVKGQPTAIVMSTVKGKDVSYMENEAGWHGKAPNDAEYEVAMTELKAILAELEGK